jgi:DNA-directed RNA polymerase
VTKYEGGYYLLNNSLIRTGIHQHTQNVENPVSQQTLDALNRVQRTPWKINDWLLDVMSEVYTSGARMGGLPYADTIDIPRKTDAEWEAMTPEQRNEWKFKLSELHGTNAKMESRRLGFLSQLGIAREMRERPAIWFPHFLDFRMRFYPMVQGLHPQCDDAGKSLLEFADGQPLGERGLHWLAVRLANTYGQDKLPLKQRVEWVKDHHREIIDSANDPLDGQRFWADTDEEPWGFLATAREWAAAHVLTDPGDYVSHLPVQLDGSCNGLQHLSAMGRDPIGAVATNVAANTERQDIYAQIAAVVSRLVSDDAVAGNPLAHQWVGRIGRKVVKRSVMTTPYGVTDRGIAEQLMQDGHTEGMDERAKAATYLKDRIVVALDETVVSAKSIMTWVQELASSLADIDRPFQFTTPTGNVIQQSYYHLNRRRLTTLAGDLVLWDEDKRGGLQARKQSLAAAPNLIHAFDASHMTRTINAYAAEVGHERTSFSMIHDSYGVHASGVDRMARVLREQFVGIYQDNWLDRVQQEVEAYSLTPSGYLPHYSDYVQLGDFDVSEVLRSEFFFA